VRCWGPPSSYMVVRKDHVAFEAGLLVDEAGNDEDKYLRLLTAGDKLAASIMHLEIEMNLGGDAQHCL
jgi:hypothetical protein